MRLLTFLLSLLLLAGALEANTLWLTVLASLAGTAAFRLYPWRLFIPRPVLDVRMASFVLSMLLLVGVAAATKDWLIVMAAVAGAAAFMPGLVSLEDRSEPSKRWRGRFGRREWRWDREPWR